jgi:hypothetical protein
VDTPREPTPLNNLLNWPERRLRAFLVKIDHLFATPLQCWKWRACTAKSGYGNFNVDGSSKLAHRLCYELAFGVLPAEIHLHHRIEDGCIGPSCVNPLHLKQVTPKEHVFLNPENIMAKNFKKEFCLHGHPYDEANTRRTKNGRRQCKTCFREHLARKRAETVKQRGYEGHHKLKCLYGHDLTPENTATYKTSSGYTGVRCILCARAADQRVKAKKRAAKAAEVVKQAESIEPTSLPTSSVVYSP